MEKEKEVLDPAILKMKRKQKLIDLMPIFGFVIITVIMIIATKGKILSKAGLTVPAPSTAPKDRMKAVS